MPADGPALELVLGALPQIVWAADAVGNVTYVNRAWTEYTGLTLAETAGAGRLDVVHPEDREDARRRWETARAAGAAYEVEHRVRGRDGTHRWFRGRVEPLRGAAGAVAGWAGVWEDAHDRRRAEEHARRYRAVTDALGEALTPDEVTVVIVSHGIEATGASAGGVMLRTGDGTAFEIVRSVGYPPENVEAFRRVPADSGLPAVVAARDGTPAWFEAYPDDDEDPAVAEARARSGNRSAAVIPLANGGVRGALTLSFPDARRFDERDRAFLLGLGRLCGQALHRASLYREARESEARFRLAADHAPVLIWTAGLDQLCDWFNQPWLEFTGRAMEQELGNGWAEGVHPEDRDRCWETYARSFDRREPFGMTYRLRRHDGEYRWVLDTGMPRFGPGGEFVGYIGTGVDVTPLREAEEALQLANADLERRVRERTAELQAVNAEQETFVYTVSHDLRAPLLAMQGMAELLAEAARAGDAGEARFLAGRVSANVARMSALLDDLLSLSRVGRTGEEPRPLDLGEAVGAALADLEGRLRDRDAAVDLPEGWPRVLFPPSELSQVLANLLGNAAKWGGRDPDRSFGEPPTRRPRLRLSWEREGELVALRVDDNGPGVPPEHRERVFALFQKLDAKAEGTGVGLAIVRRIAERHGGQAWVEDSELGGARFAVTLPAAG